MKKIIILTLLLLPQLAQAQANGGILYENTPGPISVALGNANTSYVTGPEALFKNPAGLEAGKHLNLDFMSFSDLEVDHARMSATLPIGKHYTLGVGIFTASIDGAQLTDEEGDPTGGTFGEELSAKHIGLGYKSHHIEELRIGTTFKLLERKLFNNSASGHSFDLGVQYKYTLLGKPIQFGLVGENIVQEKLKWDTATETIEELPLSISLGTATTFFKGNLKLSLAYKKIQDQDDTSHFGLSYLMGTSLILRAGQDDKETSLGLGLKLGKLSLNYSYTLVGDKDEDLLDPVSKFSATLTL